MSIPLNAWIMSSYVAILPEDELNASVQHRDGWHDGERRRLQDVSCLNAQNQLWTARRLISELNVELNRTLHCELDV